MIKESKYSVQIFLKQTRKGQILAKVNNVGKRNKTERH
jgi:hypothetical protein